MGWGGQNLSWPQILFLKQTVGLHCILFGIYSLGWNSPTTPFCKKRSIRQTLNLRVAVVCVSFWNEQKFCVAFLPWVWRTWDGYMHFRLGTFLSFTDLFKPLILLILYGLISPSFPLTFHRPAGGELVNNLKHFSKKKLIKYILWRVQHAISPAAAFLGIFLI